MIHISFGRALLFVFMFVVVLGLGAMRTWQPVYAQGDALPGETLPPEPLVYLPLLAHTELSPPLTYTAIPVEPPPTDRPAAVHPDLNLAIRGFVATTGHLGLVTYNEDQNGPDINAPQIDGMFNRRDCRHFAHSIKCMTGTGDVTRRPAAWAHRSTAIR
jgi:hypothetical protein